MQHPLQVGDVIELKAIEKLFGDSLQDINLSATKSMTGHMTGAAGVIEAIICIKAIEQNTIPPTINTEQLDPEINPNLNLTLGEKQEREVNVAMSNTFGFGGHNATVLFKKPQ
jgi:3-oxoacyl-(acyl-carrier-protein) synthase